MNNFMVGVCMVVLFTIAGYFAGRTEGMQAAGAKYQTALGAINTEHTRQLAIATTAARDDERRRVMAQDFIDRNLHKELNDEKQKTAALSAAVSAGTVQLRQRFTCPASASGDVPSPAASTTGSDAAQGGGIRLADAQFLVQLASEADQVAIQLQACQEIIKSDRSE